MDLKDKIVVITGAASGIGRAMAQRFAAEGAKLIVCADRDEPGAKATAEGIGGVAFKVDVSREADIQGLIETVEKDHGPIDLFCSNAGIGVGGGAETPNDDWQRIWDINVMAHVWAARHLVPRMAARGGGYLLNTASAAGLLSQIGSAPYAVTKHAAVGLAEWLSITYGDRGIKVSCLCPQGVNTDMLRGAVGPGGSGESVRAQGVIEATDVAEAVMQGLADERFLILPHPEVADYVQRLATDPDRWIGGMRRLQARVTGDGGA
jgi:NAD(P)-dependent dehydrogenase (short-subunit alcohol dehydrogenase family)